MMKMNKVWDILRKFKNLCQRRGWKTNENEDWIRTDEGYHNFLWTRNVQFSSFKRIISNGKCVVPDGSSYRVLKASYTAWLFSDAPSETLVKAVLEDPELSNRVAVYDLSPLFEGKNLCVSLNNTDSHVFKEFENFLKKELGVKIHPLAYPEAGSDTFNVPELA